METPHPNDAGLIALAIVERLLVHMRRTGVLSSSDLIQILAAAREPYERETRVFGAPVRDYLAGAILEAEKKPG